uniref:hypothetical protein n=1 Tax=Roseovarius sp. BRH_c41 TaxID=1629709 RepID=UPI000B336DB2|nr:hypothetical protein [Roseovarius sp. BRH_c41]
MIRALALCLMLASPAAAQQVQCGPVPYIMASLMGRYGEAVVDEHTDARRGAIWQMWANDTTGSWTLTATLGITTCIAAAGQGYDGQTVLDLIGDTPA